ncbi:hypothetical protein [Nocardioides immobilis]|nr:hypothetical protein [Nocardioides immobilis]
MLEGIYSSLGLSLDRSAVEALEDHVDGEDPALSRYLVELCPA